MNERVVSKMTNFCVAYMDVAVRRPGEAREQDAVSFVKLSNSPAITYVSRLELGNFESQPDSPRINQRLPKQQALNN